MRFAHQRGDPPVPWCVRRFISRPFSTKYSATSMCPPRTASLQRRPEKAKRDSELRNVHCSGKYLLIQNAFGKTSDLLQCCPPIFIYLEQSISIFFLFSFKNIQVAIRSSCVDRHSNGCFDILCT